MAHPKLPAATADVNELTKLCSQMGGDPDAIGALLSAKQFSREQIEAAIVQVMSSHSCAYTFQSALECKAVFEGALKGL